MELFSGAGGLALGVHRAAFRHEFLVESDPLACQALRANIKAEAEPGIKDWNLHEGRIEGVKFQDYEGVDLAAGGPPCTPFSAAGKRQGMADPRDMLPEFVRAVREARPKAFMFENVQGLAWDSFRPYLDYVLLQLAHPTVRQKPGETWSAHRDRIKLAAKRVDPAYVVEWRVLNAADFGVPQIRWRLFAVGVDRNLADGFSFPTKTHGADALLYSQWVTGDYWKGHGLPQPGTPKRFRQRVQRIERQMQDAATVHLARWATVRDSLKGLETPTTNRDATPTGHWVQLGARRYEGHNGSVWDWPSKTLKAGVHGVPGGENMLRHRNGKVRYFTIRELARLQTFPDSWMFDGEWSRLMRQVGNAAPVDLVHAVAHRVHEAIVKKARVKAA
jgi:DNA (cytosine-5)-methyltransferase 1